MEQLTLTTPITPPACTTYTVDRLVLHWSAQVIQVYLIGSDGGEVFAEYVGAAATPLLTVLNTANFSTLSLHKRILQRLQTDGKLPAGTITGTPA